MLILSLLLIALAVYAVLRGAEVRLTLVLAALVLASLAGQPLVVVRTFLVTFTSEKFLLPIGCCMGFAFVLRHTECDKHLVHLLTAPLRSVRPLLIPGVVLVGVLVNVPIISQSSCAVAVGAVLVPVLRAAGFSAITIGAALALGCSIGGELLNPGAPELQSVVKERLKHAPDVTPIDVVRYVGPLLAVSVLVATPLFWWSCRRDDEPATEPPPADFRLNVLKAFVPLLPLALLFLTALPPPLRLIDVPQEWLVAKDDAKGAFGSRLVGAAMLIGVAVAALLSPGRAKDVGRVFFEGAGYALTNVTSLIVAANCFGAAVELVGLGAALGRVITAVPGLLWPMAALMPLGFGWVSGSGMASAESLYRFFDGPAVEQGAEPLRVGALVSLAAAAGRTLSPVSAVVLMSASLSGASPFAIVRRMAGPLLAATAAATAAAWAMG